MKGIVKVKILDKDLQRHNGLFMRVGIDKALRGEKTGIWVIVDEPDQNVYENKSMTSEDMLTKTSVKTKVGLSRKDLFH